MTAFRHRDAERAVFFGRGVLARAGEHLPGRYTLLTTPRALASAPALGEAAGAVVEVGPGPVDVLAAELLEQVARDETALVALGGGRVIDVAKAIAAARGGLTVAAVPTSLSGAEMTGVHRHARGVHDETPRVRASVVVNDPALSASQPARGLAASSANALGHAFAALVHPRSSPITRSVAADAVEHLDRGWAGDEPDRDLVALGALLAGWAVDHSGLGAHHALAQTAVRVGELSHAGTNAALLPGTTAALRRRSPDAFAQLDPVLSRTPELLAADLRRLAGPTPLADLATEAGLLERVVATALKRPELSRAELGFGRDEVTQIYSEAANTG